MESLIKVRTAGRSKVSRSRDAQIALFTVGAIGLHLILRYLFAVSPFVSALPLYTTLLVGGVPLIDRLTRKVIAREFGSDFLAGLSILTASLLREYLVAAIIVLMLSGGAALEQYATRRASSVLDALAKRMPRTAHRLVAHTLAEVGLDEISLGDVLVVFPHEICPVDGVVVEGYGRMDEAYLTGEPFQISKAPGSPVLSGAINGDTALTVQVEKLPVDSRYAKIMQVMQASEQNRPHLRRLGDQLGAWYAPAALAVAGTAWLGSNDPLRFLAVMVVATPCPLLIAIPVAVIGAISLSATHGIIIRRPAVLEQITTCRTLIFDKTGTLTYGRPSLTDIVCAPGCSEDDVLRAAASVDQYSKHPLAGAIVREATRRNLVLQVSDGISEKPGEGLRGIVAGKTIQITGRRGLGIHAETLPPMKAGLECVVLIDDRYTALFRFHDAPRTEAKPFVSHLPSRHGLQRVVLVSGDREPEVQYLAQMVGIREIHAGKSPEEKLAIVAAETKRGRTLFVGDGINDAPAMLAATVGIAFGRNSDVTAEAAGAVIMEASLQKVDELIHIGRRMRAIALQSAIGGIALSVTGMLLAALGYLPALQGAVAQEIIDVLAVMNVVRVSMTREPLTDF